MNNTYTWTALAIVALVTALLRFIPFLIFGNSKKTPKLLNKMGRILPYAIMGMLVVYCLRGTSFVTLGGFLPALISVAVVSILYVWRRNTLISIISGTVCYMLLVQLVF